jgi:hypothetical protein
MKTLILLIVFFTFSCKKFPCNSNSDFDYKFINSIETLTQLQKNQNIITSDKLNAIRFLESVTGIKANISNFTKNLYPNSEKFEIDKKAWLEWYKTHRCNLSENQIDSLFILYKNYRFIN